MLGWVDFGGLRLRVREGVFVPRLRTLAVVRAAESLIRPGDTVIDLCCGVGAIGAVLLRRVGPLELIAADIDPDAVDAASENLGDHGVVVQGDLFEPIPVRYRGLVDLVAVNAPYVPTAAIATMPPEARDHEHRVALDGGDDGLDLHRRVAAAVGEWLRPGGSVVIETSRAQAPSTAAVFERNGFAASVLEDDEVDGTAVVATLAPR